MSSGLTTRQPFMGRLHQNGILIWFGFETAIMMSYIHENLKLEETPYKKPWIMPFLHIKLWKQPFPGNL